MSANSNLHASWDSNKIMRSKMSVEEEANSFIIPVKTTGPDVKGQCQQ